MKITIYLLAAVSTLGILCVGCNDSNNENDSLGNLTGEAMSISEMYERGRILRVFDDTVYAEIYNGQYAFQRAVIVGDSLVPVRKYGRKGPGPGEFFYAALGFNNSHEPYLINEKNGSLQAAIIVPSDSANTDITFCTPLSGQSMSFVSSEFIVNNGSTMLLIVAPWDNPHNIFGLYNYRNGDFTPLTYWPDDGFTGSAHSKFRFYADNSRLLTNHNGKYIYSAGNGRKAFIFSIKGDSIIVEHNLYDQNTRYEADASGLNYRYDYSGKELFMDANDSIIVFLHKEFTLEGRKPIIGKEHGAYGNCITVWDWNGNKIGSYQLDNLIYSIHLNLYDNTFYAGATDQESGEDLMWRYRIPK